MCRIIAQSLLIKINKQTTKEGIDAICAITPPFMSYGYWPPDTPLYVIWGTAGRERAGRWSLSLLCTWQPFAISHMMRVAQNHFFFSGSCWPACFLDLEIFFLLRVMLTCLLPWPRNHFSSPGHDNSLPSLTWKPFFPLRVITSIYLSGILSPRY